MKIRKPRTSGSNLEYDVSHMFNQPYDWNTPAAQKFYNRIANGQCIGCGKEKCCCKSKHEKCSVSGEDWKADPYVTKNFWKKNKK